MPAFTNMQLKPAKLFGQTEVVLRTRDDALGLFAALATRNSRATLMNDSSSRSHCFVTLTLLEAVDGHKAVRESRLQFVDMAGSERLQDAHGKVIGYEAFARNMGYAEGAMTNYVRRAVSIRNAFGPAGGCCGRPVLCHPRLAGPSAGVGRA